VLKSRVEANLLSISVPVIMYRHSISVPVIMYRHSISEPVIMYRHLISVPVIMYRHTNLSVIDKEGTEGV
jgi:hypothetical protein